MKRIKTATILSFIIGALAVFIGIRVVFLGQEMFYYVTPYVKSKVDKTGITSKIKVTKPILGEYSHAKYINSRAFISHIRHS